MEKAGALQHESRAFPQSTRDSVPRPRPTSRGPPSLPPQARHLEPRGAWPSHSPPHRGLPGAHLGHVGRGVPRGLLRRPVNSVRAKPSRKLPEAASSTGNSSHLPGGEKTLIPPHPRGARPTPATPSLLLMEPPDWCPARGREAGWAALTAVHHGPRGVDTSARPATTQAAARLPKHDDPGCDAGLASEASGHSNCTQPLEALGPPIPSFIRFYLY